MYFIIVRSKVSLIYVRYINVGRSKLRDPKAECNSFISELGNQKEE